MTACIVDDDKIYVYTFRKLLELNNIPLDLINFDNASEAINFLSDPKNAGKLPDVILLDINMPIMDGWDFMEAYEEIKSQLPKEITIYIVSSSINTRDIVRAEKLPDVVEYITKPVSERMVMNLLGTSSHPVT